MQKDSKFIIALYVLARSLWISLDVSFNFGRITQGFEIARSTFNSHTADWIFSSNRGVK